VDDFEVLPFAILHFETQVIDGVVATVNGKAS
jgi:hypothetical protein